MPRIATESYNLQIVNPSLAKEWHPIKNGALTARDITPNSNKKAWWKCKKSHEWQARINNRTRGIGCPYCNSEGRKVCESKSLEATHPSLAKEWHPTKNGTLTARDVTLGSNKKVWWKCEKGHEWKVSVNSRTNSRTNCPYCSGASVCDDNCLQTLNPSLAKEWHPTKNGTLTPKDVTRSSSKKVWWQCKKGHEWKIKINSRARSNSRKRGKGCPYCHSQASSIELRIYAELKYLFDKVEHRKKLHGKEVDIYIPGLRFAVEIDGFYWHKNKYIADKKKTKILKDKGIFLLRLRGRGLTKIIESDIIFSEEKINVEVVKKIARVILKRVRITEGILIKHIKAYLGNKVFANEDEFVKLLDMLPSPLPGFSLSDKDPSLAKEWHPTKNRTLTPKDIFCGSNKKVWWKCNKGHEWKARVVNRSNSRTNCPYCSGASVCDDNCLQTLNPSLAKEWHPTKNGTLTPKDVTRSSSKKVWWKCNKGHEWRVLINSRSKSRTNCPYCSGKTVCDDNCLNTLNPSLAKEWHPTKNGILTPKDVTLGSAKKVWWKCKKGHEWQARINSRTRGIGCPYCNPGGPKVLCEGNCLETTHPSLAKEWHPTKNGTLTPINVSYGSHKKVWWKCKKGHEWKTMIKHRSNGSACPYCKGRDNCLETLNPSLAKEWHPTKNGILTPKDVTLGSGKKVWWQCKKGHEWKAVVGNRNRGRGCPYCKGTKQTAK